MEWTKTQGDAIETRGCAVLVSAGAGSGKTAVLTERIMSLLREGISLDQLLVVTFTKAAAAEMRERILKSLHEGATTGDHRLSQQAMRIERAAITTLHGFCAKICREYFEAISIDPMFRVADEAETGVLQARALMDALTQCFESPTEEFSYAAMCLTQEQLADIVVHLYHALMAQPDPWAWLETAIHAHHCAEAELRHSIWVRELLTGAAMEVQRALQLLDTLLDAARHNQNYQTYVLGERAYYILLHDAIASGLPACALLPKKPTARKPNRPKDADDAFENYFASVNKQAHEHIKKASDLIAWLLPLENRMQAQYTAAIMLQGIAYATRTFDTFFNRIKMERNVLSYHDLEHGALKALRQEGIANRVKGQYKHVFVDEYQDSSSLQEEIIKLVAKPETLFMVGDVKQSIYRFRLAEPSLFINKMKAFAGMTSGKNVYLSENFRSHPMLLDCINDIFVSVFCGGTMEITYDEKARLYAGKTPAWAGAPVELHIIAQSTAQNEKLNTDVENKQVFVQPQQSINRYEDRDADKSEEPDEDSFMEQAAIRREAQIIAQRIEKLRNAPEKKYKLREMVILLRVVRGKASHIVDMLRQNGIPAKADIGEDTLKQVEVQDILALLRTIDNFHMDIPLIASLRGPALGLSSEEIAKIRIAHPEGTFAEALLSYCDKEDDLASALQQFRGRIDDWATQALVCPLDSLIRSIYEQSGAYVIAGALPDGKQRQDNLCLLAEAAAIYEQQETGGLSGFLRYIDRVQTREGLAATDLGEQEDIVRIMSVHKSKGLQFPVVFVAGLGSTFHFLDGKKPIQIHPTLGIGVHAIDPVLRTKQDTIIRKAIIQRKRQEMLAEQARILYVALTRAESRLILLGVEDENQKESKRVPFAGPAYATTALQWILPAAKDEKRWQICRHQVLDETYDIAQHRQLVQLVEELRSAVAPFPAGKAAITLSWVPPERPAKPLKQSVTAQMHQQAEELPASIENIPLRPLFMEEQGLTATERGDAVHTYLCTVPIGEKDFESSCRNMVARGILSEAQAKTLPRHKMHAFLQSDIWLRMQKAQVVHRERPFNLRTLQNGTSTLLQGIIDCCFLEDGAWVIVDYKTDHGSGEALIQRYKTQIDLYATALEKITGLVVKEKILYAITLKQAFLM